MSEPIIEYREEINVNDIARKYAERVARVIDEQTLSNVENQLAEFGYVKVVRCRDCRYMFDWAYGRMLCKMWADGGMDDDAKNVLYPVVKPDGFCAWGKPRGEGEGDGNA